MISNYPESSETWYAWKVVLYQFFL